MLKVSGKSWHCLVRSSPRSLKHEVPDTNDMISPKMMLLHLRCTNHFEKSGGSKTNWMQVLFSFCNREA